MRLAILFVLASCSDAEECQPEGRFLIEYHYVSGTCGDPLGKRIFTIEATPSGYLTVDDFHFAYETEVDAATCEVTAFYSLWNEAMDWGGDALYRFTLDGEEVDGSVEMISNLCRGTYDITGRRLGVTTR